MEVKTGKWGLVISSKQIKSILELIRITLIFLGLVIFFVAELHFYFLIGILIVPNLIIGIARLFLPNKKQKKSATKKKMPKNNVRNKNNSVPPTRLLSDKEIISMPLEKMSGLEFERLCFLYYKAKGYKPKETPKGADGGVDLLIYQKNDDAYEAVQVKHYLNSGTQITVREIRELNSAKQNHGCVLARFITSTTYSTDAMRQADKWRIKTHSGDWVMNKIEPWRKEEAKKKKYIS